MEREAVRAEKERADKISMNYDKEIIFVKRGSEKYDPVSGTMVAGIENETMLYANVTDLGTDRAQALFGDYKKKRKTIRLLNPYNDAWDYIVFQRTKYQFAGATTLKSKQTIIVEEIKQ